MLRKMLSGWLNVTWAKHEHKPAAWSVQTKEDNTTRLNHPKALGRPQAVLHDKVMSWTNLRDIN